MDERYVVYSVLLAKDGHRERWYYGTYPMERAEEVIAELGVSHDSDGDWARCMCRVEDLDEFDIQNLPLGLRR